ncbi:MAG: CvfD/Ygs/GSP13 family RNA-binding post-transcriptional regulator [Liquorilactobacillus ghanensis]|uniref:Polyribonucleotide nucleotidyltransferase n=2 Tax=Liquorilactobacillus ghanensis TaxID=399370 RepID=A0A0R1VVE5_9LACO|nr:CvfD/Ygs/GSP13 family RNA-binding post-transcriptional regulator [Liquorilactobacillus ghanensis]KRM06937.1 polyribonucleotide nucleotidyltransferase [Liquorilactobacillus ghanensis DSM 18630]
MVYKIGMTIIGKVTGIQSYGVFVGLDDRVQGLIHISECQQGYVADIHKLLKVGQQVKVMIIDIDEYTKKISLSLRCITKPPQRAVKTKVKCLHKHYWTSRQVNTGFEPIAVRMSTWIREGIGCIEKNNK